MTTAKSGRHASVKSISGVNVPDTKLVQEITEFIRDTETELLFNHSSRVYYFGALAGNRRRLKFDGNCFMLVPCSTTWGSCRIIAVPQTASRLTARTLHATS